MSEAEQPINWGDVKDVTEASTEKLKELQLLCEKMLEVEQTIAEHEAALKKMQKERERYAGTIIPEAFKELGLQSLKLSSGYTIEVSEDFKVNIPADERENAYDWLDDNGHGDLLKTELKGVFKKGENALVAQILLAVKASNPDLANRLNESRSVHHATLKSFIKECRTNAIPIDNELFGIYDFAVTKVKAPKASF